MAFWMDPILLIVIGIAVAYISKKWLYNIRFFVPLISVLALFVFLLVSVGLFFNLSMWESTWIMLGSESGTEYMVNGIILNLVQPGVSWTDLSAWAMFTATILFILYPFIYWGGLAIGWKVFGEYPWEPRS